VSAWGVHFWSSAAAFGAAPTVGDVRAITYSTPTAAGYATPFGSDSVGRPTYLVKFRLPGGIPAAAGNAYFAVRANASQTAGGTVGVLESDIAGASGLWASATLPAPGYVAFDALPFHSHSGVFAYRVVTGCGADYNGDGNVNVSDIFAFLTAWFGGLPGGDFDGTGGRNVTDIFAFLGAWFGGC